MAVAVDTGLLDEGRQAYSSQVCPSTRVRFSVLILILTVCTGKKQQQSWLTIAIGVPFS